MVKNYKYKHGHCSEHEKVNFNCIECKREYNKQVRLNREPKKKTCELCQKELSEKTISVHKQSKTHRLKKLIQENERLEAEIQRLTDSDKTHRKYSDDMNEEET